ncbi:PilZ domain-containing protein [Tautonia sp. JC769]|uniref:PilZ domain-containing protein n=1 Tax=Tautonia sp. JC769 TaxID=3232135 RepID=UPI00345AEBD3
MNPLRALLGIPTKDGQQRRPGGANRRRSIRHASDVPVVLGWWDEEEFRSIAGNLVDISQGGAAVVLGPGAGPPGGIAHLRLDEAEGRPWVAVEIRSVRPSEGGATVAHLEFDGGCSYALFRKALPATRLDSPGAGYASGEFDTRTWR